MENIKKYTSLKLSKKLQEIGFKGKSYMYWANYREGELGTRYYATAIKSKFNLQRDWELNDERFKSYPAYDIANDLLITYAKELFGEKTTKYTIYNFDPDTLEEGNTYHIGKAYKVHSKVIFSMMQRGKKEDAEGYIIEHLKLLTNNKEN